jgi:hypothetical protein
MVPAVICEYLLCLLSSEWLRAPTRQKAQGLLSGSCTQGTEGRQLWLNLKARLGRHPGSREPHPGASGTGIIGTRTVNSSSNICTWKASLPLDRRHRLSQRQDKTVPSRTDSTNLSGQVKPVPHSTDSKNPMEYHPPHRQEYSRTGLSTVEASNRPL